MSCTENESGQFVVFFLPAVVGCLTILLARRWANSQVGNTSSTAISRRRKIIKDPLFKRPLPPIACKMTSMGSKKGTALTKKGTSEEDVNNGKRIGRSTRLPATSNSGLVTTEAKLSDGHLPPKHIPFPFIPQDAELLFEIMTFVFTLVATGLQFLNLYRTVWWLPHSHTNQAMHFYLIDPHLVAFIVTILMRRLLLTATLTVLRFFIAPKLMPHAILAARMFILGVVLGLLAWCTYFIVLKYPLSKIFCLCYPAIVYFILFGFQSSPFLELCNSDCPLLHSCSHDPYAVRAEVELLRQDFNLRFKKILFNSVVGAYYSSFIPCWFAQSYLHYDVYSSSQQVAFVCGGLFGRYCSHAVCAAHCDVPHRAALHLGEWHPIPDAGATCTELESLPAWSPSQTWARGSRVSYAGAAYVCRSGSGTTATPGDKHHKRFHKVFSNPSTLLCLQLCLQLSLIVLQICMLFGTAAWHHFLSTLILLFINYYTLFKMVRDYLVTWQVYKAENIIQEKNGTLLTNSNN